MSDATTVLFGLPGVRVERVERWGRRHAGGARGDWGGGGGVPIVWGVLHVGESASDHEPKDIPYAEDRIIVRWCKTRWRCREDYCLRGSFTEAIAEVPTGARTTRRLRTQRAATTTSC